MANPTDTCASCGGTREAHLLLVACPRFVEWPGQQPADPPVISNADQTGIPWIPIDWIPAASPADPLSPGFAYPWSRPKPKSEAAERVWTAEREPKMMSTQEVREIVSAEVTKLKTHLDREAAVFTRQVARLMDQIRALEKQVEQYSFDPKLHRAIPADWTDTLDDEDVLTDTSRGPWEEIYKVKEES